MIIKTNAFIWISIIILMTQICFAQKTENQTELFRYNQCGGSLNENKAIVSSPKYPTTKEEKDNVYENNLNCIWTKDTGQDDTVYSVKFFDMVLEQRQISAGSNETKCFDYLNITIASIGTKQFCGWKSPKEAIIGKGPNLTITLRTDNSDSFRGFLLVYQCFPNHDPCNPNPCANGICNPHKNGINYGCTCYNGFTGTRCEIDIDECQSQPCQNGGTCLQQSPGEFVCKCLDGYTGKNCETREPTEVETEKETNPPDPCQSNPCGRKALRCEVHENTFKCICLRDYTGRLCEVRISLCDSDPCLNGGACIDDGDGFVCFCSPGWTGKRCDVKLDSCQSNPCREFEVCTSTENGKKYSCNCPRGFTGNRCKVDIDECASEPCLNGGVCTDENKKDFYKCKCKKGFSGQHCGTVVPLCTNPGIPFVDNHTVWKPGETLQFFCSDGYSLLGFPNLTCNNDTSWSRGMPVCVDNTNKTILYLPTRLSPPLIFLISLASTLTVVLVIFSTWIVLKGPWKIGEEVTKVMKLSRISLTSY